MELEKENKRLHQENVEYAESIAKLRNSKFDTESENIVLHEIINKCLVFFDMSGCDKQLYDECVKVLSCPSPRTYEIQEILKKYDDLP